MSYIFNVIKDNIDIIAKIILGSGLIAISIKEFLEYKRKRKIKVRIEEEVASEFFINEYGVEKFEKQAHGLSIYLNIVSRKYLLSLVVIKSVLSSGYFLSLDADLIRLLIEYANRFETFNGELKILYDLKGEQRKFRASRMQGDAYQLKMDLKNSAKLDKLRTKYYEKWKIQNGNRIEQFFGPEISI